MVWVGDGFQQAPKLHTKDSSISMSESFIQHMCMKTSYRLLATVESYHPLQEAQKEGSDENTSHTSPRENFFLAVALYTNSRGLQFSIPAPAEISHTLWIILIQQGKRISEQ